MRKRSYLNVHSRLLDENFGLLRVAANLILFDVCDLWLRPGMTASKMGRKLTSELREGMTVGFHASLLDDKAKIQYLASAVWPPAEFSVPATRPRPLPREQVTKFGSEV